MLGRLYLDTMHADHANLIMWYLSIRRSDLETEHTVVTIRILRSFLWHAMNELIHVMKSWFFGYMDVHSIHLPWLNHGHKIKCLHVQWKTCLRVLKKGRHLSVAFETNLFNATTRLVNLCTSLTVLGEVTSSMALIFTGFASIPRWDTIKPRNFPNETPKRHLAGLSFILYFLKVSNISWRSSTSWSILGRGKLSLEHALFRSVKSTHILHFPLEFFTMTTLASHLG